MKIALTVLALAGLGAALLHSHDRIARLEKRAAAEDALKQQAQWDEVMRMIQVKYAPPPQAPVTTGAIPIYDR